MRRQALAAEQADDNRKPTAIPTGNPFMPKISRHTPGTFCWWELATPDVEAAYRFYQTVFGWEKTDLPLGEDHFYRMVSLGGAHVGAMYQLDKSQLERKVPAAWLCYVAVENADETARRITGAGGTILQPPFDVMGSGRMAVFADSEGAKAAIWEPRDHVGAGVVGEDNAVCWTELSARDDARARAFYQEALGWGPHIKSLGPAGDYTEWGVPGESRTFGGMLKLDAQRGDVPAAWATYFKVADCDAVAAKVTAAGGKVMMGPFDAPGVGRLGMMKDSTGAAFSIIHLMMEGR
jgi:hypothetical protein